MRLKSESTTLVMAGRWNAALLSPDWVLKHGLEINDDATVTVQSVIGTERPASFTLPHLTYSVLQHALVLVPASNSEEDVRITHQVAIRILEKLTHTPVSAVGMNSNFVAETPSGDILGAFDQSVADVVRHMPDGHKRGNITVKTSFEHEGRQINIGKMVSSEGEVALSLNLHIPVSSTGDAAQALRNFSFAEGLNELTRLAKLFLAEELNHDEDD